MAITEQHDRCHIKLTLEQKSHCYKIDPVAS